MTQLLLAVIVLIGFTTEATIGFGATIISLTLAANLLPVEQFLPIFVPVNYGLLLYIVIRHHRDIDTGLYFRQILPAMGLGLPLGLAVFNFVGSGSLNVIYSLFVIGLAGVMLVQLIRRPLTEAAPLRAVTRVPLLFFAGIMHGMYSTGGPMVVYVLARGGVDKKTFRATCCAVWLTMGTVLIANFAATGLLTRESAAQSGVLVLPLAVALVLGEWLNGRVNERTFRLTVFGVLLLAGLVLLVNVVA